MSVGWSKFIASLLALWLGAGWAVCLCGAATADEAAPAGHACCGRAVDDSSEPLGQPMPERCPHCSLSKLPAIAEVLTNVRLLDAPLLPFLLAACLDGLTPAQVSVRGIFWDTPPPIPLDVRLARICLLTL